MHNSVQIYFDLLNDGGTVYDPSDVSDAIGLGRNGKVARCLDKDPTECDVGAANPSANPRCGVRRGWSEVSPFKEEKTLTTARFWREFRRGGELTTPTFDTGWASCPSPDGIVSRR